MAGEDNDFDLEDDVHESEAEGQSDGGQRADDEDDGQGDERESLQGAKDEDGQEDDEGSRQAVSRGRGANRFQSLRNENRELAERTTRLQREMDELKAQRAQPAMPDPEIERIRMDAMSPEERLEYKFEKSQQENRRELNAMQFRLAAESDRASFNATLAQSPKLSRFKEEVEHVHMEQLRKGAPVDRETILNFVVGKAVRERMAGGAGKQGKQAGARVARQQTRAGDSRGDQGSRGSGRRGDKSLEDRLAGVII